ncbi:hypothetical protein LC593_12080 [Nostoc sp. CHAB 5844]|nr:hypothetical protein [Nostoc sp. CHAB 5844]
MIRLLTAVTQRHLLNIAFVIFITISSSFILPAATWADASSLGINHGHLISCPGN